ncbi:MAG: sigma-70 family RNA polymerase sigma factor [Actinobacteria bacterium]|nr:sigma-70 family RNA polymerase sigma factor [Actinomycetota bacterium]
MALRVDDVDLVRDRALVERFQEGDGAAFETLYRRYFPRLKRFCQKRLGDPHDAEEIAQETFTRALRALPSLDGERRFYPWMTVIAARLCVDAHRRRGRSEPTAEVDLGAVDGGQDRIVDAADRVVLAAALTRLAPRYREVLDLRERRNWSYQQIAAHYGVTLGTVEALLFRARKSLRREFLAVNRGEHSWAAVPVLGLLARPLASLRARLEVWSSAFPPLAGPAFAMAVAVAATGVTVASGDRLDPPAQPREAPLHLEAIVPEEPAVAAPSVGAPTKVTQKRGPAAAAPAPGSTQTEAPALPLEITSAADADQHGANTAYAVGIEGVATVYIEDPAAVVAAVAAGRSDSVEPGDSR